MMVRNVKMCIARCRKADRDLNTIYVTQRVVYSFLLPIWKSRAVDHQRLVGLNTGLKGSRSSFSFYFWLCYGYIRNVQLASFQRLSPLRLSFQTRIQTDVTQPGIFRFIMAPRSCTICLCSRFNNSVLAFRNDRSGNWFRTFIVSVCTAIGRPYLSMTKCSVLSFLPTDDFLWYSCNLDVLLLTENDLLLVDGTLLSGFCDGFFCLAPRSCSAFFFHSTVFGSGPGNGSIILDARDDFCCLNEPPVTSDKFCDFTDCRLFGSCTTVSDVSV